MERADGVGRRRAGSSGRAARNTGREIGRIGWWAGKAGNGPNLVASASGRK